MNTSFQCDDKDTLIAYLYDDIDVETRRQVTAHLRTCVACADEVDALRAVRRDLAEWQPPEADLHFEIVQKPATVLRPSRWTSPSLPAWTQVAAAIVLFAVGAAIANVNVRYDDRGLSITSGWMSQAATVAAPPAAQPAAVTANDDWRPALTALEADLRRELQTVRASEVAHGNATSVDGNALLRRVQTLVEQSEQRQREELAIRMTQFGRDIEMQRRTDLNRINGVFGQLTGRTVSVEGNQREMYNLLRRVSSTQQVP